MAQIFQLNCNQFYLKLNTVARKPNEHQQILLD